MTSPLVLLARTINEHRTKSAAAPSMIPLSAVHKATVLMDACAPDSKQTLDAVHSFFSAQKIEARVLAMVPSKDAVVTLPDNAKAEIVGKGKLSWFGSVKKKVHTPDEELFVDLTDGSSYASVAAAISSSAPFRIARRQLKGGIISVEITGSEGRRQSEVFETVKVVLKAVK